MSTAQGICALKLAAIVSGGDAPGINTALYHFAALAAQNGDRIIGVQGGFPGLLEEKFQPLLPKALLPWSAMPGSLLASSRVPVLSEADARAKLAEVLRRNQIDGLIMFGGDGTLRHIPPLLRSWGVACVGIPTTIDNDVPGSEYTLGFDSACNFALPIIDGVRATGAALEGRIFTVETLGGTAGFLALEIARAAGADAVALPEYKADINHICARLRSAVEHKGQALLVYTEGVANKDELLSAIPQQTGIRVRSTLLGHAQRGGSPTHRDRAFAAQAARAGYEALRAGRMMSMTVIQEGRFALHDGDLSAFAPRPPDISLYNALNHLEG
mgnify:CR=1 FL=1|jgi:6-phosphofructokinase 1